MTTRAGRRPQNTKIRAAYHPPRYGGLCGARRSTYRPARWSHLRARHVPPDRAQSPFDPFRIEVAVADGPGEEGGAGDDEADYQRTCAESAPDEPDERIENNGGRITAGCVLLGMLFR